MVKIGNISLPEFPLLLAPMEDVSDPPFRVVCKANGADLTYTEFISSESLVKGGIKSRRKLDIFETERPVGVQLYGGNEESMERGAAIADDFVIKPALLGIHFGCPRQSAVPQRARAGVLKDLHNRR